MILLNCFSVTFMYSNFFCLLFWILISPKKNRNCEGGLYNKSLLLSALCQVCIKGRVLGKLQETKNGDLDRNSSFNLKYSIAVAALCNYNVTWELLNNFDALNYDRLILRNVILVLWHLEWCTAAWNFWMYTTFCLEIWDIKAPLKWTVKLP